MHEVEVRRRMGEEDISAVAVLLRAAEAADGHAPLGEHQWIDLVHGGRAGFAGFVARTPGSSRLLGYAQLSRGHESWAVECVVHPAARAASDGVTEDLLRAALDEVRAEGGGHVHLWVPKPGPEFEAATLAVGLRRGRTLYQMRRPLPLEPDLDRIERLPTRAFRVGVDEVAWLAVNNRAFHGHPEQGAWELATLREREALPWFDPEDFLVHDGADGRLDAFCWTKIHDEEPALGEIYVLGVDPDAQGGGLGRRILLTGLDHLSARGMAAAMLYADAGNEVAVRLYRSLGFAVDHRDQAYVGDVAAGPAGAAGPPGLAQGEVTQ